MTSGPWFGCWRCGCSDVERTPEQIPTLCPTHGDTLIADNLGRRRVELDGDPVSGFGVLAQGEPTESQQ